MESMELDVNMIRVSDYIVSFLISKGVTDVFGYPGGMVTSLMDSLNRYSDDIKAHVNYHEQSSAFAACGYAQSSGKLGVAYATSGPGATNLITGICNAYFDSIPTMFITGQVNQNELKGDLPIRQRGFQETDIVSMIDSVTKMAVRIHDKDDIPVIMNELYNQAVSGRPGPVLLDIPMNIMRSYINVDNNVIISGNKNQCVAKAVSTSNNDADEKDIYDNIIIDDIVRMMKNATRPCIIIGAGMKSSGSTEILNRLTAIYNAPIVSSMIAFDELARCKGNSYGFIGAYGNRVANFIVAKCDLIIALGTRLDVRQVGGRLDLFASNAKLIRVDIDECQLQYKVKDEELSIVANVRDFLDIVLSKLDSVSDYSNWICTCDIIRKSLSDECVTELMPDKIMRELSSIIPDDVIITTDVGQNQVWTAQSYEVKSRQKVLFSGGHGAMGYSLPAAIGAYYGSNRSVVSISGDGGLQMNIQELQFIAREKIPVCIIVFNNNALGMIRHFQEMYYDNIYYQTTSKMGYTTPNFRSVAQAYGIEYHIIKSSDCISNLDINYGVPNFIEVYMEEPTYVYPKLEYGKLCQDQEPLIDREIYDRLMQL